MNGLKEGALDGAVKRVVPPLEKLDSRRSLRSIPGVSVNHSVSHFSEYCRNTSIHGLRYVGEVGRPAAERFLWLMLFGLSLGVCSKLINNVWIKWDRSPVIVTFAESSTPVWQVPFPAVTICSETKSRQSVFNFTDAYNNEANLTEEEQRMYSDVSLVCDAHVYNKGDLFTNYSTVEFLKEVAPPFDEMMFIVKWKNRVVNASDLFKPLITEEGLCYSFNMLDAEDFFTEETIQRQEGNLQYGYPAHSWTLEDGYTADSGYDTYPERALGAGARNGMFVLLRAFSYDLDYICRGPVQGFKVLLHNPAEVPRVSLQYLRAPLSQEVVVAVKPNMMTTSDGLRSYSPHRRQCYFPYERHLRYFKVYTQQNCELECLTNFTLNRCSCVSFHMPRTEETPICGSGSTPCVQKSADELVEREVVKNIEATSGGAAALGRTDCDCLPACTVLNFDAETSQAHFDWANVFTAYGENFSEMPGVDMARVSIYFKDMQFITSRRSELYGITDFIANCGGLLGLFMGFSLLSLVEFIYFFTIRIGCTFASKRNAAKEMYSVS
ncbi:pickpocket protein 28-like [Schistocerca cancellata]|uniref:pickpocket protein 28-like n=1 Tax=Schistocerca cancellata TaxID=274614 RepID=UPI0021190F30|nr:pickpocket protein 28-like [Schistocerca cancellata]